MSLHLQDIVKFQSDRLFQGAVSIDWFLTDIQKREKAAQSFVFHGPQYHGVIQADVGTTHGHHLQDTATFARAVIRSCFELEDQPFTLAIAGYGTGKSHLALTLATLLNDPAGDVADSILANLEASDASIGSEVRSLLEEQSKPPLIITLNGMQNFDLTSEFAKQVVDQVKLRELDTQPLDELRPRFRQAANLIRVSNESVLKELLDVCDVSNIDLVIDALEKQDEHIYSKIHKFFDSQGMPIRALGGESVRDVIDIVAREYCGENKPFSRLLILFDEFGRYTEFATTRSQIAGSGVLQDLFEAVQSHPDETSFVGFIQFELNAYVQRIAPEYRNDILRYVTRYQSANRVYLSINLETLIASLIEKQKPDIIDSWFDTDFALQESEEIRGNLNAWFPQSYNHKLWIDRPLFHTIIRKGCWPLSPYATWFLFYLAAAGKHLQERSALALLGDVFQRYSNSNVTQDGKWSLTPVDFWSDALEQELIHSEETGQQGSITHAYTSVHARHRAQLSNESVRVLRAVVLASKMGLKVENRDEAIEAISEFTGLTLKGTFETVQQLQEEYNVLEWDDSFKSFDILGDAVPRTHFLAFLRKQVASIYDEEGKAKLFASKASSWCDLLNDIDCDFSEDNRISTREWTYQRVTSNLDNLLTNLQLAADRWKKATGVNELRGTVIYCYVDQNQDPDTIASQARKVLRSFARNYSSPALPIFVILLCDEEGSLGQALAELSILEESITESDRVRFGNLIGAHKEKQLQTVQSQIDDMLRQRRYITGLKEELRPSRLSRLGTELFQKIYRKPIPFPFDGFNVARGNAADTCQQFITELMQGKLDYDGILAKPPRDKNRAIGVLSNTWGVFTKAGKISRRPSLPVVKSIMEKWDKLLQSDQQRILLKDVIEEVCLPPFGGNIASVGLMLGLFVAPRIENLAVVQGEEQYSVSQWVQEGIFKSKYLDLAGFDDVALVSLGEASSEWEELFDEWEQEESYYGRSQCLKRAKELQQRIPVPPAFSFRFAHLEEQGLTAQTERKKMMLEKSDSLQKIYQAEDRNNAGDLSWGAAELVKLRNRMKLEGSLWTQHEIADLDHPIETATQTIIQIFPDWISHQYLKSDAPDAVGKFKHVMVQLIGRNLKELGLDEQYQELEDRTTALVRNAETSAEAGQLIRDVRSWLSQHSDALRIIRVAEIRGLMGVGKDYSAKLRGMAQRIDMAEIPAVLNEVTDLHSNLRKAESDITKRFSRLLQSRVPEGEQLGALTEEIEELITAFEGCQHDLEDLRIIRRVLQTYQRDYLQLQDDHLNWQEFDSLIEKLRSEAQEAYGDEEIPWEVDEIFSNFHKSISKQRKSASLSWIQNIESEILNLGNMSTSEVSRLHSKAILPPAILTEQHIKRLKKIARKIETHLESLKIEWLIEEFSKLPDLAKKKFMEIVSQHMI